VINLKTAKALGLTIPPYRQAPRDTQAAAGANVAPLVRDQDEASTSNE